MPEPRTGLVDLNAAVGPWPTGEHPSTTVQDLLAMRDKLGIEHSLVFHTLAWKFDPAIGNRRLLDELAGHPGVWPCMVLSPVETDEFGPPDRVVTAMVDDGARGIRVFPADHGWTLDGPEARRLFGLVEDSGLPLFVDLAQTTWTALSVVLEQHGGMPLIVSEAGYRGLRVLFPLLERFPQLRVDLSYLAAHDAVELIVDRFGDGRVVFGSGWPRCEPNGAVARLSWADLPATARQAIGTENGSRLLRVPAGLAT